MEAVMRSPVLQRRTFIIKLATFNRPRLLMIRSPPRQSYSGKNRCAAAVAAPVIFVTSFEGAPKQNAPEEAGAPFACLQTNAPALTEPYLPPQSVDVGACSSTLTSRP
jgi:hypothetical protein